MFTGLIEDVGRIAALRLRNGSAVLTVQTKLSVAEWSWARASPLMARA